MAGGSQFVWIALLLSVNVDATSSISHTRNSDLDHRLSHTPVKVTEGTDPNNVNETSVSISTCVGLKKELTLLNRQLQDTTLRNRRLDDEASGLRRDVRLLKTQLTACSSTHSANQAQLQNDISRVRDHDTFLILKIIQLTRELETLQIRINATSNSSETDPDIRALQSVLQDKQTDLDAKKQQLEQSKKNAAQILQVISMQNQIWDLEQEESRRGETSLDFDKRIMAQQEQLDSKIRGLSDKGDPSSNLLRLISMHSKIVVIQRLITVHTEKSQTNAADYRRQMTRKSELLKRKILLLNRDENNADLTREILSLQTEVVYLRHLMLNAQKLTSARLKELRVILEQEKKQQEILQKSLEEMDDSQSVLIIKIINTMKEMRTLNREQTEGQQQTTSNEQVATLQGLLQTKEKEYANAQANIKELQRKLKLKTDECSGFEEKYTNIKTELEEKITELNRTGESKTAHILNLVNLHNELKTLGVLISTTEDPAAIVELQRQQQEKQDQLNSKTADMERLFGNPTLILRIIELQNEIWDHQRQATDAITGNNVTDSQTRLDDLIDEINSHGNENIKLMLKILTLQSQVDHLQRQLSDLNMVKLSQVAQLEDEVTIKKEELQKYVSELNEKNQKNAQLILTITNLNNQLRNVRELKEKSSQKTSSTITSLQDKLNQMEEQCSGSEQQIKGLQNNLDEKIKELKSKSDSITSLTLQISTLTMQQEDLKKKLQNTESKAKVAELQKQLDEMSNELARTKEELREKSSQPQRLLQIITIQTEIEKYGNMAQNDTDYDRIRTLQERLNHLIEGVQDEDNENTKLVLKILTRQQEMARLWKAEESQKKVHLQKIQDLENDLEHARTQITEKTRQLDSSDLMIANLTAEIMELHKKIKPLEDEISYNKKAYADKHAELQKKMSLTKRQLQDTELLLKDADTQNFNLIMEIADLNTQLKKAQKQESKVTRKNIEEMEEQLQQHKRKNRKLEMKNRDLEQMVQQLQMRCSENTHCEDEILNLQSQLTQSQKDVDGLQRQLEERDARLEQQIEQNRKLLEDNKNLQNEKTQLEDRVKDLQNKLSDAENIIHASQVKFDPNTAHPRIALCANNTEIHVTEEAQSVPDNPGRFDVALAVLGKTGFSAGRHYWEVSVAQRLCYLLGMASESAPRKGLNRFSPANGYWTIVLNKAGELSALDTRSTVIPVQTRPQTLGILLDYKKGQISFYNADARSHLYTFTSQGFTDTIYPFVDFCVEDATNQAPVVALAAAKPDWINQKTV